MFGSARRNPLSRRWKAASSIACGVAAWVSSVRWCAKRISPESRRTVSLASGLSAHAGWSTWSSVRIVRSLSWARGRLVRPNPGSVVTMRTVGLVRTRAVWWVSPARKVALTVISAGRESRGRYPVIWILPDEFAWSRGTVIGEIWSMPGVRVEAKEMSREFASPGHAATLTLMVAMAPGLRRLALPACGALIST